MQKWSSEELDTAKRLLMSGYSYRDIGNIVGRSDMSVRGVLLSKYGIQRTDFYSGRITKQCLKCTGKFSVTRSSDKKYNHKFCSHSCAASYNNVKRKQVKHCVNCQSVLSAYAKKYCCTTCQHEYDWKEKKIEIIIGNVSSPVLLKRYLVEKDGHRCSICDTKEWCGQQVPLVLDHINGDALDCSPKNLRLLCPNCDHQTETFSGRNKGKGTRERYYKKKSERRATPPISMSSDARSMTP